MVHAESQGSNSFAKPPVNTLEALKHVAKLFKNVLLKDTNKDHIPSLITESDNIDKVTEELQLDQMQAAASEAVPNVAADIAGSVSSIAATASALSGNSSNKVAAIAETANQVEKSLRSIDSVMVSLKNVYSVIKNGLRRYEITDTDCQSRIVCEIHQKIVSHNKLLKSFSLNALDVLR